MLSLSQTNKVIEILANKFSLDLSQILKKPYGSRKGFNGAKLLSSLLCSHNLEEASQLLGYTTRDPIKDAVKTYLSKIPKHGGKNCNWRNVLLFQADLHWCYQCNEILSISEFSKLNTRDLGIQANCKKCSYINANNRKEYIKERTPIWANVTKIEEIYRKCPLGCHVDHIIPLRGELVSGLHIETNLQYLTAEDNHKKSNKILS